MSSACLERDKYSDAVETGFCWQTLIISRLEYNDIFFFLALHHPLLPRPLLWAGSWHKNIFTLSVGLHPVNIAQCIS